MPESEEQTMSSKEVAALLGVSPDTVRRWVRIHKLIPINPPSAALERPKAWRFNRADVLRLTARGE